MKRGDLRYGGWEDGLAVVLLVNRAVCRVTRMVGSEDASRTVLEVRCLSLSIVDLAEDVDCRFE